MVALGRVFLKRQERLLQSAYRVFILSRFRDISKRQWVVLDERKLAYLTIAKSACSTIKYKLLALDDAPAAERYRQNIHEYPWNISSRLHGDRLDYTTFTFVRNPLARLVSMYKNKFEDWHACGQRFGFENYLFGVLHQNMTFDEFVDAVCGIPDRLADPHFKSQYSICYKNHKPLVRHIWKLEEADANQTEIERHTGLAALPVINKSSDAEWDAYYSPASYDKAVRRYAQDIKTFAYQGEVDEAGRKIKSPV